MHVLSRRAIPLILGTTPFGGVPFGPQIDPFRVILGPRLDPFGGVCLTLDGGDHQDPRPTDPRGRSLGNPVCVLLRASALAPSWTTPFGGVHLGVSLDLQPIDRDPRSWDSLWSCAEEETPFAMCTPLRVSLLLVSW